MRCSSRAWTAGSVATSLVRAAATPLGRSFPEASATIAPIARSSARAGPPPCRRWGRAAPPSSTLGARSASSTSSLAGKCRKNVRVDSWAAAAICATVVRSYPFSSNSRKAASMSASRVRSFFASRSPMAPTLLHRMHCYIECINTSSVARGVVMGSLDGQVALITGAGRGIGRQEALFFASEGAKVVVNDPGVTPEGTGGDPGVAESVAREIRAAGGDAVANADDVTDWDGARRMVETAVEAFGDLHVVVNNAAIQRRRALVNMTEDEFDAVLAVHLKGTFAVTRWAARHWRDQGNSSDRAVVNTVSASGLLMPGITQ